MAKEQSLVLTSHTGTAAKNADQLQKNYGFVHSLNILVAKNWVPYIWGQEGIHTLYISYSSGDGHAKSLQHMCVNTHTCVYHIPVHILQYFSVYICIDIYHYNDVIMGAIASQIPSLTIVYSIVYSDADARKHQSSASLAFVRGIHRGPVIYIYIYIHIYNIPIHVLQNFSVTHSTPGLILCKKVFNAEQE